MSNTPGTPGMPITLIIPTAYGQMLVNRHDINQTNALFKTGFSVDHAAVVMLSQALQLCKPNPVFVDVGANFGVFSLALARGVGREGKVHAFEPQRILFNMLAGSVALNSLFNVFLYNMAVGDREGKVEIPQFDYTKPLNFGSIEFGAEQREALTQPRGHDPALAEFVPLTTLDRMAFERVDLLKIDAEGMEMQILDGARETIARCRPVMFVEHLKCDAAALRQYIAAMNYEVIQKDINYLCLPVELTARIDANPET